MNQPTTLVIHSGGLDSTTALWLMLSVAPPGEKVIALTFDYGQRHHRELHAAKKIIDYCQENDIYGSRHRLSQIAVSMPTLGLLLSGNALTDQSVPVPEGHYEAESMRSTVVPNRNMIFAAVAAGIAEANGADRVILGVHGGDHAIYPDCRQEFISSLDRTIQLATDSSVSIYAPFVVSSKASIVGVGHRLGVPFELTWSCYQGNQVHCGRCGTCTERREAFQMADVPDPTEYEA